ncbi:MAG: DUF309 domain-containing protein [Terracidiphilus sp.]|nr:DUF309 domain-containing protein [Terracidiphilus sp.]
MPLDWKSGPLAEGLACYRKGEFFHAHEFWESVWIASANPQKNLLQALIQITVALHHAQSGNRTGAEILMRKALRRLESCPAHLGAISVPVLRDGVSAWLLALDSGAATNPAAPPQIHPIGVQPDTAA